MKIYSISEHSEKCSNQAKPERVGIFDFDFHLMCKMNPEYLLFLLNNEFYLITYHNCITEWHDKYEFKTNIIKKVITGSKIKSARNISKSHHINKEFKDYRLRGIQLRSHIDEINYLYYDNTGKEYAIVTTHDFIDKVINQDTFRENYKAARKSLENYHQSEYLLNQLQELYYRNAIESIDEVEIVKSIDHLVKQINLTTK